MDKNSWIIILAITIIWAVGAIGIYLYSNDIQTIFLSINCFAVIIATTINLVSILQNHQTNRVQKQMKKLDNTFDLLKRWDAPLLTKARDYTRQLLEQSRAKADDEKKKDLNANPELKGSVISVFNCFQLIALAVEYNIANEDILKTSFSKVYDRFSTTFKFWLEDHIRNKDPEGYDDLQNLKKRWFS